jgi:predicted nucleic acid-binding protein
MWEMVPIKRLRLYLETTVFNYYFDEARDGHEDTVRLFEAIGDGEYEAYTSEYVMIELRDAKEPKRSDMLALVEKYNIVVWDIDAESRRIANLYIQYGIIPAKYWVDAAHIAVASIHELDCVLSFNYKHINKLKTKRMSENVNLNEGYKGITICTPMEVLD